MDPIVLKCSQGPVVISPKGITVTSTAKTASSLALSHLICRYLFQPASFLSMFSIGCCKDPQSHLPWPIPTVRSRHYNLWRIRSQLALRTYQITCPKSTGLAVMDLLAASNSCPSMCVGASERHAVCWFITMPRYHCPRLVDMNDAAWHGRVAALPRNTRWTV